MSPLLPRRQEQARRSHIVFALAVSGSDAMARSAPHTSILVGAPVPRPIPVLAIPTGLLAPGIAILAEYILHKHD